MSRPFWCEQCRSWTHPDVAAAEEGRMACRRCGENFGCGECGYEIDAEGNCQRASDGAGQDCGGEVTTGAAMIAGVVAAAQQARAKGRR